MKLKISGMSEDQICVKASTAHNPWIQIGFCNLIHIYMNLWTPGMTRMNRYVHTKVIQIREKYSWSLVEHTPLPFYFFSTAFALVLAYSTSSNIKYTFLFYKFSIGRLIIPRWYGIASTWIWHTLKVPKYNCLYRLDMELTMFQYLLQ